MTRYTFSRGKLIPDSHDLAAFVNHRPTFSNFTRYVTWLLLGETTIRTKSKLKNERHCVPVLTGHSLQCYRKIKPRIEAEPACMRDPACNHRGLYGNALYKSTFYLLTYLLLSVQVTLTAACIRYSAFICATRLLSEVLGIQRADVLF